MADDSTPLFVYCVSTTGLWIGELEWMDECGNNHNNNNAVYLFTFFFISLSILDQLCSMRALVKKKKTVAARSRYHCDTGIYTLTLLRFSLSLFFLFNVRFTRMPQ